MSVNSIYEEIWNADIAQGNGLKIVPMTEQGNVDEGYIAVDLDNIADFPMYKEKFQIIRDICLTDRKKDIYSFYERFLKHYSATRKNGGELSTEESSDINAILFVAIQSPCLRLARNYIQDRELFFEIDEDWINYIKELWFEPDTYGKTAFQHVFLGNDYSINSTGFNYWYDWYHNSDDVTSNNGDFENFIGLSIEGILALGTVAFAEKYEFDSISSSTQSFNPIANINNTKYILNVSKQSDTSNRINTFYLEILE